MFSVDAAALALAPPDAAALDPQARRLLELSAQAFHDVVSLDASSENSITSTSSWRRSCGVFVGCMFFDAFDAARRYCGQATPP